MRKLRGRGPDELWVRGAQALSAYAERRGWSAQARVPPDATFFRLLDRARAGGAGTPAELLAHFRRRSAPRFFAAFDDPAATLAELRRRRAESGVGATVEAHARRVCEGRFDLLGMRDLCFGQPVDWRLEPTSGKRSALVHWSRFDELDPEATGDKKVVWELNRHQHFMTLGRAYWHTRDERYAETFVSHLAGWIEQNPPKLGVNWLSSLEVAFRSVSWLWALYFFKDSPRLSPGLFLQALKFLYLHARHLETYLSVYFSPNTHLTGEALGLYYLGTLLPEFRRAARWRAAGRRILIASLARQVRPDGVYFEQSSYYHRYTTDFYLHLFILSRANGERLDKELTEKLTALLDHLMHIARPDGTTPLFGDDDGGRLVKLDERAPDDFRAALSTGAALFARPDYKHAAGGAAEETLWLLGADGLRDFDRLDARPPRDASRAFPDGGYYVMRDGWRGDDDFLLMDCGPHGALSGAHAHADALSFELAARGRTLLVDPGTYTYTASAEARDLFRATAAHNTLTIDGQSSSVPGGPFSWKQAARAKARAWVSHDRFDFFEGEHDGYLRLPDPCGHARSVLFLKHHYWVMRDHVTAAGAHRYDLHFHFAPGARAAIEAEGGASFARAADEGLPGLRVYTFARGGEWRREEGWVSRCYGARAAAPVCVFSKSGEGEQDFFSFLLPHGRGEEEARVREVEAEGGRAFELLRGDASDLLLAGGAGGVCAAARAASDFEWAWARFDRRGAGLKGLVLLSGSHFSLGGRDVVSARERVSYLVASLVGGEWRVESDPPATVFIAPEPPARAPAEIFETGSCVELTE